MVSLLADAIPRDYRAEDCGFKCCKPVDFFSLVLDESIIEMIAYQTSYSAKMFFEGNPGAPIICLLNSSISSMLL